MSRHVTLRHVMSCHVMSCHVMSCHVMSCHVTAYSIMSGYLMSRHDTSCHVISYLVMSCIVSSNIILSCHATVDHVTPQYACHAWRSNAVSVWYIMWCDVIWCDHCLAIFSQIHTCMSKTQKGINDSSFYVIASLIMPMFLFQMTNINSSLHTLCVCKRTCYIKCVWTCMCMCIHKCMCMDVYLSVSLQGVRIHFL